MTATGNDWYSVEMYLIGIPLVRAIITSVASATPKSA